MLVHRVGSTLRMRRGGGHAQLVESVFDVVVGLQARRSGHVQRITRRRFGLRDPCRQGPLRGGVVSMGGALLLGDLLDGISGLAQGFA